MARDWIPLGKLLVQEGLLSSEQLHKSLEAQVIFGGRLGTNLVELQYVTLDLLADYLSLQKDCPNAGPAVISCASPEVFQRFSGEFCAKYKVFPLNIENNKLLHLAMCDPMDLRLIDEISFALGLSIQPWSVPELRLMYLLEKYFGIVREHRYLRIAEDDIAQQLAPGWQPRRYLEPAMEIAPRHQPVTPSVATKDYPPTSKSDRSRTTQTMRQPAAKPPSERATPPMGYPAAKYPSKTGEPPVPSAVPRAPGGVPTRNLRVGGKAGPTAEYPPAGLPPQQVADARFGSDTAPDAGLVFLDQRSEPQGEDVDLDFDGEENLEEEKTPTMYLPRHVKQATPTVDEPPQVEVPQPEAPQIEVAQPEVPQPEGHRPEVPQIEVAQPEVPQIEVAQPEVPQIEVAQPEAHQPEAHQVEVARPEGVEIEVSEPEAPPAPPVSSKPAPSAPMDGFDAVCQALQHAQDGKMVANLLVQPFWPEISLSLILMVRGQVAVGICASGTQVDQESVRRIALSLSTPSLLKQAHETKKVVFNRGQADPLMLLVASYLQVSVGQEVYIVPICLGRRVINFLYLQVDQGAFLDGKKVERLSRLGEAAAKTYLRLIQQKKGS